MRTEAVLSCLCSLALAKLRFQKQCLDCSFRNSKFLLVVSVSSAEVRCQRGYHCLENIEMTCMHEIAVALQLSTFRSRGPAVSIATLPSSGRSRTRVHHQDWAKEARMWQIQMWIPGRNSIWNREGAAGQNQVIMKAPLICWKQMFCFQKLEEKTGRTIKLHQQGWGGGEGKHNVLCY